LNIFKGEFYRQRALANISGVMVQKAERGIIFDRYGKPLVENKPIFNAILVPSQLPRLEKDKKLALDKIREILNLSSPEFEKILNEADWEFFNRILLARDLPQSQAVALQSVNLAGLQIENDWQRDYSGPETFSHLLGYVGLVTKSDLLNNPDLVADDLIGKTGLEAYYDSQLRGENGKTTSFRDARGRILAENLTRQPQAGQPLQTFIDAEFQEYFFNRLQQGLKELDREIGVGLAINPSNGEVLALVNLPAFDGSRVVDFLNQPNQPLFNRAIAGLYAPGSAIKPLVAAAALKEKIINTQKEIFSAGYIEIPNPYHPSQSSIFWDWKPHGWVNFYSALARSSNVYFYAIAGGWEDVNGLGISKLREYWQRFALGSRTNIDLVGEKNGFLPLSSPNWRLGDTYNVAIGQGDLLLTPLQLLNCVTAIANGGEIFTPRIAKNEPQLLKDLGDLKGVFSEVEKGMVNATQQPYGTAYLLSDLPFTVAAKTGTAQINLNTKINALFVGYGPVPQPQIAILVLVENAREGSINTIPIAKDVFKWYYENRIKGLVQPSTYFTGDID
jgi:penicillin-binding protein 2